MDKKAIGKLRHVVVSWQVENYATRMRLKSWKTNGDDGGGVLGNFVSHCFHYLEYFCGPLSNCPRNCSDCRERGMLRKRPSPDGRIRLRCGLESFDERRFLSRHRGTAWNSMERMALLMLVNTTADYMRGFELFYAHRPAETLARVEVDTLPMIHNSPTDGSRRSRVWPGDFSTPSKRAAA